MIAQPDERWGKVGVARVVPCLLGILSAEEMLACVRVQTSWHGLRFRGG